MSASANTSICNGACTPSKASSLTTAPFHFSSCMSVDHSSQRFGVLAACSEVGVAPVTTRPVPIEMLGQVPSWRMRLPAEICCHAKVPNEPNPMSGAVIEVHHVPR